MTKKDYVAIAWVIQKAQDIPQAARYPGAERDYIANKLAEYFKLDNPRFNSDKFLNAADIGNRW